MPSSQVLPPRAVWRERLRERLAHSSKCSAAPNHVDPVPLPALVSHKPSRVMCMWVSAEHTFLCTQIPGCFCITY